MDDRASTPYIRRIHLIVVSILLSSTAISGLAAGIVVDGRALKNQQPVITETANGIPQINIQTPNSSGVSRNKFKRFDIDNNGGILNNSAQHSQTQLGGWVQGNSLLAGGTARIILNEVNSQNPSLLHGPVELAGDRADVVIANPAGISCDGCGFINAHRATLTTGMPLFNGGKLTGFDVRQGHISISGAGMNDRGAAYSDLISRTVRVNADIWADELKIVSGVNQVSHDGQLNVSDYTATDRPELSLDVTALGGMYADSIHLVGTEHGVGVRHAGSLQAQTLVLASNGQLKLQDSSVTEASQLSGNVTSLTSEAGSEVTVSDLQYSVRDTFLNEGLLDAKDARISATEILNTARGAIYADELIMESGHIRNQSTLSAEGSFSSPVIAARQSLKVASQSLFNDDAAVVYSDGDADFGAALSDEQTISGEMTELVNFGGLIEAGGELSLNVSDLHNLNAGLVTEWRTDSVERIREVQPEGWSRKYDVSRFPKIHNHYVEKQPFVNENGKQIRTFEDYTYYDYTATTESTHLISSKPGQIISGGNLRIAGNVNNEDSEILAGGDLTLTGANLTNHTTTGEKRVSYKGRRQFRDWEGNDEELDFYPWTAYSPAAKLTEFNFATTQVVSQSHDSAEQSLYSSEQLPVLSPTWFQQITSSSQPFFIETDPQFIDYRDWLSSDYMLEHIAHDPSLMMKRLGDGFIEQRLVREQIAQLTGHRFLSGFADDEAQFMALMDAGISFAKAQQLSPGVALSAEQVAMLTSDIVWLEQQNIQLQNGKTITALVPKVYVKARAEDLIPGSGLLAGHRVDIELDNDLINTGTIAGREVVRADSGYAQHHGHIQARRVQINAENIDIRGGTIQGQELLELTTQQDMTIASVTSQTTNTEDKSRFSRTNIKRVAGLYVTGDSGEMRLQAGQNISLSAADIQHYGDSGLIKLSAENDMTLGTVLTAESNNSIHNGQDFNKHREHRDVGTRVVANGDISLNAGNKTQLIGTTINSRNGNIGLKGGEVEIHNATASYRSEIATHTERDGTFSSKSKDQRDVFDESTAVASVLSGQSIRVESGADITINGSQVVADQSLDLKATETIKVTSAEERYEHERYVNEEESGLLSSGGIGFTVGSQQLDVTDISTQTRQFSSELGSLEGDVTIIAGNDYVQKASNVMAVEGDIDVTASSVNIESATETLRRKHTTEFSQSGLSISITNPVISAVQAADQMVEAAEDASDPRMKALAAAAIGLNAKSAYDDVLQGQGRTIKGKPNQIPTNGANGKPSSRDANAADKAGGINLAISLGSSKSSTQRNETIKEAKSSKLIAGGDINIAAIGDANNSNLTVKGSEIQAGESINLKADDALNLVAAENSRKLRSKNDSSSGSVGISIGTSGLLFTAGTSKGKGKENGHDRSWTETTVRAGEKVALDSGGDTELRGAIVRGKQLTAEVGGDLNIQSLQDSSSYDAENKTIGGSISVGYGRVGGSFSHSVSEIDSDYISVIEQSGIHAGDGGFQIAVNGNTNLKGAVIASTQDAIEQQRNSLLTRTLSISEIRNEAEYDAESSAVTVAMGTQDGEPQLSGAGIGREAGSIDSVTVSAVSAGELLITDKTTQELRTGDTASTTATKLNRDIHVDEHGNIVNSQANDIGNTLSPIFDEEKVAREINAQVQITQAFGQQAYKAVGEHVRSQRGTLQNMLQNAQTETEKEAIEQQLDELLLQERVMNVLIGAVSGIGESAVTKESLSVAAAEMREIMIQQSGEFAGVTDGSTEISNDSGKSAGVRGDRFKLGGTRIDLDVLCGADNSRCLTNEAGELQLNGKRQVQFDKNKAGMTLAEFLETDEGKQLRGPTGGIQGAQGTLFGIPYEAGSWQDKLIEAFSGTHDMIGGQLSGLYDKDGNATRGRKQSMQNFQDAASVVAIAPSAPFAMAELLSPEVWQAVSIILRTAQ